MPEARLRAAAQDPDVPPIPCHPAGPPAGMITPGPNGVTSANPSAVAVVEEGVAQNPIDIAAEFPSLLAGNDAGLQEPRCTISFDIEDTYPTASIPDSMALQLPSGSLPPNVNPSLPPIIFVAPSDCLGPNPAARCGRPLDCRLPFCGRDIIFVHGLIDEALVDMVQATNRQGPISALALWPPNDGAFIAAGGYFRRMAERNWQDFILNKLRPAYRRAGVPHGPRFLVVAWPVAQRMEFGVHALLWQIAGAMRDGTNVMTLGTNDGPGIVSAGLTTPGFCGRGCIIVSASTGGPLSIAATNIAANASRPWVTPSLRTLPTFIKGHVAFHPALGGAEIAWQALALVNGPTGRCTAVPDLLNGLGGGGWTAAIVSSCAAVRALNQTVLVDLTPPVMNQIWRPVMTASPSAITNVVPTLVVAGAHPTKLAAVHWVTPVLPGYDDGVLSVDSQLGRPWTLGASPRSLRFNAWGLIGTKYYDRGSPTAQAIPYFFDQNIELYRRPLAHAAAPNPFLTPTGMVLPNVSLHEVSASSSGLPHVFSFLQSTAGHLFRRRVGDPDHADSQPNNERDGCPPDSYSYQPTGNYFGPQASVSEESRAVFDSSVYTTRGRNHFSAAELATGPIPLLSPALMTAIEGEARGRYVRLRIRLPPIRIDRTFWIWKREYVRMRGWRCRDEIDYAFDFAFRR